MSFSSAPRTFAILAATLLCMSCAVSPEVEEQQRLLDEEIQAILGAPLDASEHGETKRCLSDRDYRSFRALDDQRILFEGRSGRLWLNTLRFRCPDLRHSTVLSVRSVSPMGRFCDSDTFRAGDWFSWPWYRRWPWQWGADWGAGMTCALGKFRPVTADQVEAIEAAIDSR